MTPWQLAAAVAVLAAAAALLVWRAKAREAARQTISFGVEVRTEVQKITWPTRDELRKATLVILAFVVFVALLIGLMDIILQWLVVRLPGRLT